MTPLKKPVQFETTFGTYTAVAIIDEGGAGRVYGATGPDGAAVAVKLLSEDRATTDRRKRFRNEIQFLLHNKHPKVVTVIDHGLVRSTAISGPFYVMRRFDSSLRDLMRRGLNAEKVLPLFSQLLDGVESAHLQGVTHRDLKPENVLFDERSDSLAVADFGIAHFSEDLLITIVETAPAQRLANFQYAAPEQRQAGRPVGPAADLFALGLILNEMFTGGIPHGTGYKLISNVAKDFAFLDDIVARLIQHDPARRPQSISELKGLIQQYRAEAVSLQRLSEINATVIQVTDIDDPLAFAPPTLISGEWDGELLTLNLDRQISRAWVDALGNMGSYSSAGGHGPETFTFRGNRAFVRADEHEVQSIIDHFKTWLPKATSILKYSLEQEAQREKEVRRTLLQREREAADRRLRVQRNMRI